MIQYRPWQPPMLDHIAEHPRCAVFGRMGSGKTMATGTAISCASQLDEDPVLVLGPKRVANKTWPDEFKAWDHLKHHEVVPVIGTQTERLQALAQIKKGNASIYTINYDNLPWLVDQLGFTTWPFRTVVADESTRLKNFRTRQGGKRSAALAKVAFQPQVKRWVNLTGTPASNGLKDLWGQTWFLDKGERLGRSYSAFTDRWFTGSGFENRELKPTGGAQDEIHARLGDICLTINPGDWITVPEPIVTRIEVELEGKAKRMYRDMEREMFLQIREHEIEAVHAASRTIKCLQLANGAIYLNPERTLWEPVHNAKMDALESIVEEACGMPVLVAYHFKTDLERLKKHFPQGREFDANPATEDAWNEGRISIMFIHPASGGHGVNLQHGGNILAFFGHWWDMEQRDQVLERIGPMRQWQSGKGRSVYIYDIVAKDTVDEDVLLRHTSKRSVQETLLEALTRRT